MTNLPHAPLVYTLGLAHFTSVPDVQRFVPAFHDAIRGEYPHFASFNLPQVSVAMSPEGLRLDQVVAPIWQCSSPDRSWAFILTSQLIALHTVRYEDHKDFAERLRFGLERLLRIDGIGIAYVEAVGMRYVDRIVPRPGEALSHYLKQSVLPPEFNELPEITLAEGVYVSRYLTADGELRFQVLRNPPTVLPPELESPLTQQNGWKVDRPAGDFAVVDIDYGTRFGQPQAMDVDFVCEWAVRLRGLSKAVFENIGTPYAMTVWKGEA